MFHAKNVALNGACIALDARPLGWECVKSANNASLSLKAEITPISFLASIAFNNN
jgi:hypothetical protein